MLLDTLIRMLNYLCGLCPFVQHLANKYCRLLTDSISNYQALPHEVSTLILYRSVRLSLWSYLVGILVFLSKALKLFCDDSFRPINVCVNHSNNNLKLSNTKIRIETYQLAYTLIPVIPELAQLDKQTLR